MGVIVLKVVEVDDVRRVCVVHIPVYENREVSTGGIYNRRDLADGASWIGHEYL